VFKETLFKGEDTLLKSLSSYHQLTANASEMESCSPSIPLPSRPSTALSGHKIKPTSQAVLPLLNVFAAVKEKSWSSSFMIVHTMLLKFGLLQGIP
jgi:hypothetical protein